MRPRTSAALVLVVAVVAVSWGSILVRLCQAEPLAIAFWRVAIAAVVLAPFGFGGDAGPAPGRRTRMAAVTAGLCLAIHFAAWIQSLAWTSVASSVLLVSTAPVFTAVLSPWVLGERPGRRAWVAVVLTLAGSAVLAGGDLRVGGRALLGDALAVVGALAVAVYLVVGRRVRAETPFVRYLVVVNGSAALALAAVTLSTGTAVRGFPGSTWLWLVLMALGPSLLGHGLLNWSVRRLRALTVQTAVLGEPVLATGYAWLLLGEVPAPTFYPGAGLIAAGVVLAASEERARG